MLLFAIDTKTNWIIGGILMTLASLVATIWIWKVLRDLNREEETCLTEPADLLGPLSEAFDAGQMSEEEFKRIQQAVILGKTGLSPVPRVSRPASAVSQAEIEHTPPPPTEPGPESPGT